MATDCVLVAAAAVVTRLVSSQLARKQVNGRRAGGQPVRGAASSDRHERSATASAAAGVHRQVTIESKIFHLVNDTACAEAA